MDVPIVLWRLCPTKAKMHALLRQDISDSEWQDHRHKAHVVCELRKAEDGWHVALRYANTAQHFGPYRDLPAVLAAADRERVKLELEGYEHAEEAR